jgi:hypothetical protein
MNIAEGHFRLYTHITPALKAGDYRFTSSQQLTATGPDGALGAADLPVQELQTHVRVDAPRYLLPTDQVLSTYPPAGTEGAYGTRLPQVVIKRRTLPWERAVDGGDAGTPWLALVVFAEGEASVLSNVPVAECVTPGVVLDGVPEVEKGACLEIRRSRAAQIMPTRMDVPLLAHAREVNINDTELMMGDDDGFLAVVIANRLPLAALDTGGNETPVKYHAVLVSLEGKGQFGQLLEKAPPHAVSTGHAVLDTSVVQYTAAEYDHHIMESTYAGTTFPGAGAGGSEPSAHLTTFTKHATAPANEGTSTWTGRVYAGSLHQAAGDGYQAYLSGAALQDLDPLVRFPVLLHWTFTTEGNETFEELMRNADSGLLGTRGTNPVVPQGRPPLEVVETGHVGLDHRTLRGDLVRAWYRGPLLPHPPDETSPRLLLAHSGDQLRVVIPDGREDLSLASAFEIGRLLALSQPSMVASLMRWRQGGYQAARLGALWDGPLGELGLKLEGVTLAPDRLLGVAFARGIARAMAARPGDVLGDPLPIFTSGTPMGFAGAALDLVAAGFGLQLAASQPLTGLLRTLQDTSVPRVPLPDFGTVAGVRAVADALGRDADVSLIQYAAGALSAQVMTRAGGGLGAAPPGAGGGLGGVFGGIPVGGPHADGPDALDEALRGRDAEETP